MFRYSLLPFLLLTFIACQTTAPPTQAISFAGKTMGSYYKITYFDPQGRNLQSSIDSFLLVFNNSTSTYLTESTISTFNKGTKLTTQDAFLLPLLKASKKIYQETDGHFDPTIMPLVNHWGFGYEQKKSVSQSSVDSLLNLVDFNKIAFQSLSKSQYILQKEQKAMQLDFSAIAKGYGVDLIGELLEKRGISAYLIDIGGEMRAAGNKPDGTAWKVAIAEPVEDSNQQQAGLLLKNRSLASSGNYRNFYVKDGKKLVHTINPKTGYPEISNLLSASIVANTCMEADAYATACMVMGLEKAKVFVLGKKDLEALFIYGDEGNGFQIWQTEGLERLF